jgi:UDP-glucose 4-epimerase
MTRILITGAAGVIGRALLDELPDHPVIAADIVPPGRMSETAEFHRMDVTGPDPARLIAATRPEVIVHLASVLMPTHRGGRAHAHAVDVTGTANVLAAALAHGVRRLVVTSSAAVYGHHPGNPVPLRETDPLRPNPGFAFAERKSQVERMLAAARRDHPQLEQVVLRVGIALGAGTDNQITALFRRRRLLAVAGSDNPFVFIWTGDLARILRRAATDGPPGIYNAAGDGTMTVDDIARALGKPVLRLPVWAVAAALGLSQYGAEQARFLQYRPVLANAALKRDFGFTPQKSSAEAFDIWRRWARL